MTEIELLTPSKIIYSKRKSIALSITNDGSLLVRAPKSCKEAEIYKFIVEKSNWIINHRLKAQNDYKNHKLVIENDESLKLLDSTYTIQLTDKTNVKLIGDCLCIPKINTKEKTS